jgi:uncharacterized RDD family membrane protein YckC
MLRRLAGTLALVSVLLTAHGLRVYAATAAPTPAPAASDQPPPDSSAHPPGNDASWDDPHDRGGHGRHERHSHPGAIVNLGRDSTLAEAERAESVVSIFGSSISDGDADDVVAILGDARITGHVSDTAVAVMGGVYLDGRTEGDVVAVFGDVTLGPHADVGGSVIAFGGELHRDPAAVIHGEVENLFPGMFNHFDGLRAWTRHCLIYARPLALASNLGWAWELALAFLALYLLLALLFREGLFRCVATFEAHPGHSVLAALIAMLATPVLIILLFATVIGIAAVPFVMIALFCASLFGRAVMLAWIGRRLTIGRGSSAVANPAWLVLIGAAVVLVLYIVPVIGMLTFQLLGFLGFGAVIYTLLLSVRARQNGAGSAAPAAASPPASPSAYATAAASSPSGAPRSDPTGPDIEGTRGTPGAASLSEPPAPLAATLPRAGFMRRMAALLIDLLVVGLVTESLHHMHQTELVLLAAYGAVMWKLRGSTVGGLVLDLKVVRLDGRELDWPTSIVRALGCFLSLAVAGLGFFWIAFDPESQAWHDKIAGTVVVRVGKPKPLV